MRILARCEYGNHKCDSFDVIIYTDRKNGIKNDTQICRDCYRRHILKFYPASKEAKHLRKLVEEIAWSTLGAT